jgi:hypothetical protein
MTPSRIRNHLIENLHLPEDKITLLSAVQSYVQYYRRRHLGSNDNVDMIAGFVKRHLYSPLSEESAIIGFDYDTDAFGGPVLGDWSDS